MSWFSNVLVALFFTNHDVPRTALYVHLYVCIYVRNTITFESLDTGSSFSLIWYISLGSIYKGHKVGNNSASIEHTDLKFVCITVFQYDGSNGVTATFIM